jgi:sirohydrochlorin cobaltochelatase
MEGIPLSRRDAATMPESRAILLVGHGTRDARGVAEFIALANQLSQRLPEIPVVPSFLELAEPTIDAATASLIDGGARQIVVLPVLLFSAGHAKRDIPDAVTSALARYAPIAESVSWRQAGVLECHPALLELAGKRLREALDDGATLPNVGQPIADRRPSTAVPDPSNASLTLGDDLCLVVVGRGSYDDEATAAMRRFAAMHAEKSGIRHFEVAFVAMAEPKYPAVLREVARRGYATVVVQPHFLFAGELLEKLRADVFELRREFSLIHWRWTSHLGPDPLLGEALARMCRDELDALAAEAKLE